jgi:kinesin family member 23
LIFIFLGLLFTYGITSSGKTFTIQGRPDAPGVIPRTVDVLFNSISCALAPKCTFKPDKMNGFDVQSEMDALIDRQRKERELEKATRGRGKGKDTDGDFTARCMEDTAVEGVDEDCLYSVFVSYVEIYNNYAFDLLQPDAVAESGCKQ